jgi:hypothetical protein
VAEVATATGCEVIHPIGAIAVAVADTVAFVVLLSLSECQIRLLFVYICIYMY